MDILHYKCKRFTYVQQKIFVDELHFHILHKKKKTEKKEISSQSSIEALLYQKYQKKIVVL